MNAMQELIHDVDLPNLTVSINLIQSQYSPLDMRRVNHGRPETFMSLIH